MESDRRVRRATPEAEGDPDWREREILYGAVHQARSPARRRSGTTRTTAGERRRSSLSSAMRPRRSSSRCARRRSRGSSRTRSGSSSSEERGAAREGTADFDDLLVWARDLCARAPRRASYFRRRFGRASSTSSRTPIPSRQRLPCSSPATTSPPTKCSHSRRGRAG